VLNLFRYLSRDDTFTAEPDFKAATDHLTDEYSRAPLPYDSVASRVRFKQEPRVEGAAITTVGVIGLVGGDVNSVDKIEVGFEEHELALRVQNALNNNPFKVTELPGFSRAALLKKLVTTGKVTLTFFVSVQMHVAEDAPAKVKSVLQAQLSSPRPASSVGESKRIDKESPLSVN
jgi:hypothetical protein